MDPHDRGIWVRALVVLSLVLWVATLIHHVDDVIAQDYVGPTLLFAARSVLLLALHLVATVWVWLGRRSGYVVLGLLSLWWAFAVFIAHAVEINRGIHDIAAAEPAGWAPVFLGSVFVGGATALATVAVCGYLLLSGGDQRD